MENQQPPPQPSRSFHDWARDLEEALTPWQWTLIEQMSLSAEHPERVLFAHARTFGKKRVQELYKRYLQETR